MDQETRRFTRAPHLIGEFGEGLVTYLLLRRGYEVAVVNHIGADLIAAKNQQQFAVSVKTRLFRAGSRESRGCVIPSEHLTKLSAFAKQFDMRPLFAHVVSLIDDRVIYVFILPVDRFPRLVESHLLRQAQHGYALRFQRKVDLDRLAKTPDVIYARWREESIGEVDMTAW